MLHYVCPYLYIFLLFNPSFTKRKTGFILFWKELIKLGQSLRKLTPLMTSILVLTGILPLYSVWRCIKWMKHQDKTSHVSCSRLLFVSHKELYLDVFSPCRKCHTELTLLWGGPANICSLQVKGWVYHYLPFHCLKKNSISLIFHVKTSNGFSVSGRFVSWGVPMKRISKSYKFHDFWFPCRLFKIIL